MNEKQVILIVDDVATNVHALANLLKDDYTIKVASGGARALELAALEPIPDLILLDVEMPEMNGYDVCKILKEDSVTADIPVIFVTGKDSESDEEYGFALGAVDYITKPIRPTIVKARVKTHVTLKHQHDMMVAMATHDHLTGLYNRHYLNDALHRKFSEALRHKESLSVVIIDIDHFKSVNDTFGHLMGDLILKAVGAVLQNGARKEDIPARFGGEEFVLVMDNCELDDARNKAEHFRELIEALHPEDIAITASFGVAELNETMGRYEELLKRADDALYHAKKEGRNCVVTCDDLVDTSSQ